MTWAWALSPVRGRVLGGEGGQGRAGNRSQGKGEGGDHNQPASYTRTRPILGDQCLVCSAQTINTTIRSDD